MGDPDPSSWLNKSEVPSSEEINDPDDEYEIEVPVNKVAGQWVNKQEYLKSHHLLLREDGVSSLRNAVSEVRNEPHIMERDSQEDAAIYENVYRALVSTRQKSIITKWFRFTLLGSNLLSAVLL